MNATSRLSRSKIDRYSAVFAGRGGGRMLTKDEQSALQKWVAQGGSLLLSGEEGQRLFGNEPPAWLSIQRWNSSKPVKCAIQKPERDWIASPAPIANRGAMRVSFTM